MKKFTKSLLLLSVFSSMAVNAEEVDCLALARTVTLEVSADKSGVLEIVAKHVSAAPGCACEIVKSAIKASEADAKTVAAIVGASIAEAPEQLRLISQCAIAVAPDAVSDIQALLATLDPNSGESVDGSKSAKGGKAAAAMSDDEVAAEEWNPLDFPTDGNPNIGNSTDGNSNVGNSVGPPVFRFGYQGDNTPPVIDSPFVTNPNP